MGRWAVEHLLRVMRGEHEEPRHERMECPLIVRDSVTRISA
jgi:DNA-binding LacI/PurR family transcriptional regulator